MQLLDTDCSVAFAKKYLQDLQESKPQTKVVEVDFTARRRLGIGKELLSSLRSMSAKSWTKTETLLAQEILLHDIDADLIDPWQVSGGIHKVYKYAIEAYAAQHPPLHLVTKVSPILGKTRQEITAIDPRAIGYVAMQYHYTGMQLVEMLPEDEQANFATYVKVLDDHLYMPLQRAYKAAGKHSPNSVTLQAVQVMMSNVDGIAQRIVDRVNQVYPRYRCYSGLLRDAPIRTSSVRDVEMFQVYMWVCLLEGNLQALQEELFPLCVMIYPRLNVSWELVRQMTYLLSQEMRTCLSPEQARACEPYYAILTALFSPDVFPNSVITPPPDINIHTADAFDTTKTA